MDVSLGGGLLLGLGFLLIIEGLLYAAFPGLMKRAIRAALDLHEGQLRTAGLFAALIGLVVLRSILH